MPAIISGRPFWHMAFVGLTGVPTFLTVYYYHQLLTQIGLLMVFPIGLFVAGQIALLFWLGKRRSPVLRAIGKAGEAVTMYLALFEGLLLTVLVFWAMDLGFGGDPPASAAEFAADFVIGATYLSMFIYGAVGIPMSFVPERGWAKAMGALYAVIALVPPFWLVFFHEETIRAIAERAPGTLLMAALAWYMAMSAAGMFVMMGPPARPRSRRGADTA